MDEQDSTALQRFDEPPPRPALTDVLEAVADALEAAIDPAAPALTTTRCRAILVSCQTGKHASHDDGGAQLIGDLERLTQNWRAS